MSKHKFDFVIYDNSIEKTVMRFYPKGTDVHSFDEEPPKNWNEVYKVYYSWRIYRVLKYKDCPIPETSEILYDMPCDECSAIPKLGIYIKEALESGEDITSKVAMAFGQPATIWTFTYNNEMTQIVLENTDSHQMYKFWLSHEDLKKFAEYIDKINDYALKKCGGSI